ncbi:hypothetical protein FKP32DRAFT_811093 [Trametes sanguinea]|nr:hypothetical protein FKP32DRAFT_811093 [Trametes sanguinea]
MDVQTTISAFSTLAILLTFPPYYRIGHYVMIYSIDKQLRASPDTARQIARVLPAVSHAHVEPWDYNGKRRQRYIY